MYQDMLSYARKLWLRGRGGGALRNSLVCCREIASSSGELSRLGRSLEQVIHIVDELVRRKIHFVAQNHSCRGQAGLQTKMMIALFGLFAGSSVILSRSGRRKGFRGRNTGAVARSS